MIVPSVFSFIGYKFYQKKVQDSDKKLSKAKLMEDKYVAQAKQNLEQFPISKSLWPSSYTEEPNLIKLQDFKRKVFVIGVYDDPACDMVPLDDI